jgi:hypothetical protein
MNVRGLSKAVFAVAGIGAAVALPVAAFGGTDQPVAADTPLMLPSEGVDMSSQVSMTEIITFATIAGGTVTVLVIAGTRERRR